ncbi:GAF domain-containing protein [Cohnella ginsengisoli]|uniref:GAF domain-containing protein n=1 Tax=Cohnella ginsengisoli TaxID=425004 RepID=A0A9X4KEV0_9BACL|nr:GAF domain-containing protein [Cohnella ginsengisoli]MDG0790660.1 GAF domain-containing protein [Cohnella ginsengisoli]
MTFNPQAYAGTRAENEKLLLTQLQHLIEGEPYRIANLANASALLRGYLADINWVGFYLLDGDSGGLALGPFQGLPACVRIPMGKGVCGTSAARRETLRVPDVHAFPGHIACDAASRSEIVVPLFDAAGELIGVLDIDSPLPDRFSEDDQRLLERFNALLAQYL